MTYTVRYNVWVSMSDEEYNSAAFAFDIDTAFKQIPGFIESSFEDSYED